MRNNKEQGYSLIEMILVVGLLALGTVLAMSEKQAELDQLMAKNTGNLLHVYNSAVRAWLSDHPEANMPQYTGSNWLKPASCGGPAGNTIEYLPCDFPQANNLEPIKFGKLVLTTEVVTDPITKVTRVTTLTTPFTLTNGALRTDLAGLAAITAAAGGMEASTPITQATGGAFRSDPTTGVIVMIATNNPSTDAWLRTDGTNQMNASIRFNPSAINRQIENVSRLQNLVGQILYIGNPGGASAATPQRVVVDADETLLGQLVVNNAKNQANGLEVVRGDIRASSGDLHVSGTATARQFIDQDNQAFLIDPAGTSRVNALNADGIVRSNSSVRAPIFYDENNTAFYLDPSSVSNINSLSAAGSITSNGRLTANEYVQINGIASVGGGCSPNGLVGRDGSGKVLSCVSGVWQVMGGGAPTCNAHNIAGYSSYDVTLWACPAGYTKMGWDTTGMNWRSSSTPGIIIGQNDYATVFCCRF